MGGLSERWEETLWFMTLSSEAVKDIKKCRVQIQLEEVTVLEKNCMLMDICRIYSIGRLGAQTCKKRQGRTVEGVGVTEGLECQDQA